MLDLPGFIPPELAQHSRSIGRWLRPLLAAQGGVIAAWLPVSVLDDSLPHETAPDVTVLALVEPGCEGSVSVGDQTGSLTVAMLDRELMCDAMEWDADLARTVATGYRLCGAEREALEMESLAREVVQVIPRSRA